MDMNCAFFILALLLSTTVVVNYGTNKYMLGKNKQNSDLRKNTLSYWIVPSLCDYTITFYNAHVKGQMVVFFFFLQQIGTPMI